MSSAPAYYYNNSVAKSYAVKRKISQLFLNLEDSCAQATVCEYIDLHKYKISKSTFKIRATLVGYSYTPFHFVHCLN